MHAGSCLLLPCTLSCGVKCMGAQCACLWATNHNAMLWLLFVVGFRSQGHLLFLVKACSCFAVRLSPPPPLKATNAPLLLSTFLLFVSPPPRPPTPLYYYFLLLFCCSSPCYFSRPPTRCGSPGASSTSPCMSMPSAQQQRCWRAGPGPAHHYSSSSLTQRKGA